MSKQNVLMLMGVILGLSIFVVPPWWKASANEASVVNQKASATPVHYAKSAKSEGSQQSFSRHWLLDVKDETQRITRLEKYLRGMDQPMLEAGQRYRHLYQALQDESYELAGYQWQKIRKTIANGVMKRPARERNAKLFLLDTQWEEVYMDIMSKQKVTAWKGFAKATGSCMGCHAAEQVAFVNNQPLFKLPLPLN